MLRVEWFQARSDMGGTSVLVSTHESWLDRSFSCSGIMLKLPNLPRCLDFFVYDNLQLFGVLTVFRQINPTSREAVWVFLPRDSNDNDSYIANKLAKLKQYKSA
jgi:hypothetical protein